MEDGWTTRQKWQKDAVDDWAFRLPQMQESVQNCSRQKEDLDDQKPAKIGMPKKRENCRPECGEMAIDPYKTRELVAPFPDKKCG